MRSSISGYPEMNVIDRTLGVAGVEGRGVRGLAVGAAHRPLQGRRWGPHPSDPQ